MTGEVAQLTASGMSQSAWASLVRDRRPCKIAGLVAGWPAIELWQGPGGLERMQQLSGSSHVQVMQDQAGGGIFYGSIMGHTREMCSFSYFLDSVKSHLLSPEDSREGAPGGCYLAQAPIIKPRGGGTLEGPLSALMQDLYLPPPLQSETLSECNLWMNSAASRSSTHYDPYHNLLCVVAGAKSVTLHSPQQTRCLYPQAVYGEASNHSSVDFARPDLKCHPAFIHALKEQLTVALEPGDSLFIPEGWWHQVDSIPCTVAVNFWWPSPSAESIGGESNAFFLRETLAAAVSAEKDRLVASLEPYNLRRPAQAQLHADTDPPDSTSSGEDEPKAKCQRQGTPEDSSTSESPGCSLECATGSEGPSSDGTLMTQREALALQLLVLDMGSRMSGEGESPDASCGQSSANNVVARVVAALTPAELRRVLEGMAERAPRALEVFWLDGLTPLGAELVTRKLEALSGSWEPHQGEASSSQETSEREFYHRVYSVCEDQQQLMAALVRKKEAFSATACLEVFTRQLNLPDLMEAVSASGGGGVRHI